MKNKRKVLAVILLFISWNSMQSQNVPAANGSDVRTVASFLAIAPDARAAGMGETGVATSPDVYSMHWNIAKLAFAEKKFGAGLSYTPWLHSIFPDVNLGYLSLYMKPDSVSAVAASVRYFSMGELTIVNGAGSGVAQYKPYEFAIDLGYTRRIAKYWSLGIAARFINSNLTNGINTGSQQGKAIAIDLGIYHYGRDRIKILSHPSVLTFGAALTNVGNKIKYVPSDPGEFIPINLRVGEGIQIDFAESQKISFQLELNKLLVPTQPIYDTTSAGQPYIVAGKDPHVSVATGMVQSFFDAPGGKKEEMHEINFSFGAEYVYNNTFAFRTGYFYESPTKGSRQFITLGGGVKFRFVSLDLAYLVATNGKRNPMKDTMRFSLQFQFDHFRNK
ncbi:MAG: type IX secretion system outer membrane channel protein PorV [Bacteroidia bacterium]